MRNPTSNTIPRLLLLAALALLTTLALATPAALAATGEGCANEQLRAESNIDPATGQPYSQGLPECRAYEMVSPPEKGGTNAEGKEGITAATDGDAAMFLSASAFGDAENALVGAFGEPQDNYVARRESSGWLTTSANPPRDMLAKPSIPRDATPENFDTVTSCGNPVTVNNATSGTGAGCALRDLSDPWVATPTYPSVNGSVYADSTGNSGLNYEGSSADLSHLVFSADQVGGAFLPAAMAAEEKNKGGASLYDITGLTEDDPQLSLVNVNDSGEEIGPENSTRLGGMVLKNGKPCVTGPSSESGLHYQAISATGSAIYFTACPAGTGQVDTVYARVDESSTVDISDPSPSECTACSATLSPAEFAGASADGSKAFFVTSQQLLNNDTDTTADLYEYDFNAPTGGQLPMGEHLVQLSYGSGEAGTTKGKGAEVQGVVASASDGTVVYFVASGVLTNQPDLSLEAGHQTAVTGADNLYAVDTETGDTKFIGELCSNADLSGTVSDGECSASLNGTVNQLSGGGVNDIGLWNVEGAQRLTQDTSTGQYLLFDSYARLIANGPEADTNEMQQVYRYDFQTGTLVRISVGEPSYPASQNGNTPGINARINATQVPDGAFADINDQGRAISEDGATVAFATPAALQANDVNTGADPTCASGGGSSATGCDVYEWHECTGGRCEDGMAGEVSMITPGDDPTSNDTQFGSYGMSASGSDIFFYSSSPLVAQDPDELIDLYDARTNGGFPAPTPETASCSGEACQGESLAPPATEAPGTATLTGVGNLAPGMSAAPTTSKAKVKTRAQKLAAALKSCRQDKGKARRKGCEAKAQKEYGAVKKATKKKR